MSAVRRSRASRCAPLSAAIALALLPHAAWSQDAMPMPMDHSQMDHSAMEKGAATKPATPPSDVDLSKVDHSKMDHSKMDHSKMDESTMGGAQSPSMDHSQMDHSSMQHGAAAEPSKPAADMDHSQMGDLQKDDSHMDHSTMDHASTSDTTSAPTEPLTPIPTLTDADRAAAAPPAHGMHDMHDNAIESMVTINRLETWNADPGTGLEWEGQAWVGTDLNRLWLRSEGERIDGRTESADLEVLYGRAVATWWDVVVGLRHDFKPGDSQNYAAVGVIGLAPQKFEVEATAYVGEGGQTAARLEAEYDLLLTNRLILQPLVEANLQGKNDPRRGIGSGLNTIEAGFRLRYEVTRRFAPYVGIVRERAFGQTADYRRADGDDIDDTRVVAGVRVWF